MSLLNFVMPPWLTAAWSIAKSIPWWVYAAAALIAFHFIDRSAYADKRVDAAVAAAQIEWRKDAQKAQDRSDAIAKARFDELQLQSSRARAFAEWKLDQQSKDSAAALAALKGRLNAYVSPQRLAAFPALPRGFVRFAGDAAAFANGGGAVPAGATVVPDDDPSGVSLAAWADYVADQAAAFRSCTQWGTGWRDYAARLKTECTSIIDILKGPPQ